MPTVQDTVTDQIIADFVQASVALGKARRQIRLKDCSAHRAAVTEWERAIDVLLDMLLQVRLAPPRGTVRPAAHEALRSAAVA